MNIIMATAVDTSVPLAKGGTAVIYKIFGDSAAVAKIYNDINKVSAQKLKRLETIDLGDQRDNLALPISLVAKGPAIIGFTQPYYETNTFLTLDNWIEQPLAAKLPAKLKDLSFILSILLSLARIIEILHLQNVCIVDLKPANVLVNKRDGSTRVIDCDSFCILDENSAIVFPAKEVTVGYFEPDSLNAGRSISELSYSQDDYAFGVIAFQLLNFGLHPYQGVWQTELPDYNLETLSKQGVFPYARQRSAAVLPLSVSVHETFPEPLRTLFDRTFSKSLPRVTIRNWINVLEAINQSQLIEVCGNTLSHTHSKFKHYPCGQCHYERHLNPPTISKPKPNTQGFPKIPPGKKPAPYTKLTKRRTEAMWVFVLLLAIPIVAWLVVTAQERDGRVQSKDQQNRVEMPEDPQDQSSNKPKTNSRVIELMNMPLDALCQKALNTHTNGWDSNNTFAEFVEEAHRRNLSISDCRVAMNLGPVSSPTSSVPPNSVKDLTAGQLCRKALNPQSTAWATNDLYKDFVAEARSRTLSIADCRLAVGAATTSDLPSTEESPPIVDKGASRGFTSHFSRDIIGDDISSSPSSSSDDCEYRCNSNTDCLGFVFDRWNGYCVLKSSAESLRGEPKADSYLLKGISPDDLKKEWRADLYQDRRFLLPAYKRETHSNVDLCIDACLNDSKCWGVSYTSFTRQCELHDSLTKAFVKAPGSTVGVIRQ
jgi:serine/threonine protein kinase